MLKGVKDIDRYPTIMTTANLVDIHHENRKIHIHVVSMHSNWWYDHILFRDYLSVSHVDRIQYKGIKQKLLVRNWNNGNEYASVKSDHIKAMLERTREWK